MPINPNSQFKHQKYNQLATKLYKNANGVIHRIEDATPTDENIQEVTRKLLRLQDWALYFGIETKIPGILDWIHSSRNTQPLLI
jgi:hypothetical protein